MPVRHFFGTPGRAHSLGYLGTGITYLRLMKVKGMALQANITVDNIAKSLGLQGPAVKLTAGVRKVDPTFTPIKRQTDVNPISPTPTTNTITHTLKASTKVDLGVVKGVDLNGQFSTDGTTPVLTLGAAYKAPNNWEFSAGYKTVNGVMQNVDTFVKVKYHLGF